MRHKLDNYRDDERLKVVYCNVCGKEGLKLILEPECAGVYEDRDLTKTETEAK